MGSDKRDEFPVVFSSGDDHLTGIVHPGELNCTRGVLVAVGGPQYRVGSHRQFLLLARHLAARGSTAMRFDYAGMGDSTGQHVGFENTYPQIVDAVGEFVRACPEINNIVLWGLCDAASTIAMYACDDPRITKVVLVNPWVRSDAGLAKARIKHYYWQRFFSSDFWSKIKSGKFRPLQSLKSLASNIRNAASSEEAEDTSTLSERMANGLRKFDGDVLIVLCGADVTALEFEDTSSNSSTWSEVLNRPNVKVQRLPDANHTFSRTVWREQVFDWTSALVSDQ